MPAFRKLLNGIAAGISAKRGVSSAEYAILAVAIVFVVGAAIRAYNLNNPMTYAGDTLTSMQSSVITTGR
ncbi:hypothetical protein GCM10011320_14700 [Neoroseomonas lacus]|uniref:Flp family type IVb pilin n=2 Tax=Neoroseomonas lacus TaxID=287609 RepID=A0A917KEE8_9PROT|nr:hypothetical protein GCM10011320_14700 [Neoroseomonas lacus]